MKLYVDTANLNDIKRFEENLPLAGVTMNPSITAKSGVALSVLIPQIRAVLGKGRMIFSQVIASDCAGMVEEASRLSKMDNDIVIKIPVTAEGLKAIKQLKARNVRTLGTAVYTTTQGLLAALAGAEYVAPYYNRIEALSGNGLEIVSALVKILALHAPHCKVFGASYKNNQQFLDCLMAGCECVTLPADLAGKLLDNPSVDAAVAQFQNDWRSAYGSLDIK
ncbi:transaldolase family protein [Phytobacter massiliensis]|uniref:transaldolase family protein n=1 Tax=Phytobacter massiliensis TaxID=1485952 RepID=UPI000314F03D|nr:transaldolase family protein [Phytobacter massiliensis]